MPQLFRRAHAVPLLVVLGLTGTLTAPSASLAASSKKAAVELGDRALRVGASGADVRELQQLLRGVGIEIKANGKFDAATAAAVKRFQSARGLEASGVVGKVTVTRLRQAAMGGAAQHLDTGGADSAGTGAAKSLGDRIPIRKGMSGHDVKVLQDFLKRSGEKVTVDGEFGNGTVAAERKFEKANKLDVDGVVDANDIAVLRGQVDAGPHAASAAVPVALAPGDRAQVGSDGMAIAPAGAPDVVRQIIAAGNVIAKKPYIYGGGHGKWDDAGYDCSGSVSYALHAAGLLKDSMPSGGFESWGEDGPGQWVTIYANSGHIYMVVAGLRFDTSGAKQDGSRWHASVRPTRGYTVRHPEGL